MAVKISGNERHERTANIDKKDYMRYRLACFDLDGTLLDTLGGLAQSLNAARRMNGLSTQTEEQVRTFINNGVVKFIERSLDADPGEYSEELKTKLLKDYVAYYNSHYLENTKPYNGITELLIRLKSEGMLLACVTNKDDEPSQKLIAHFFPELFDYVRGSLEGVERKPSSEPVERCLYSLGTDNSAAVYIGDSDTDILTAKNSGLDSISCTWGYRTREFLLENGAVNICTAPVDLSHFMR
ncbi:MAG: HAD-IA family hydrolase [Saccharofermentans sp.]|nr:HAD-IA family hydrolase [Saccharofermentans sp.]